MAHAARRTASCLLVALLLALRPVLTAAQYVTMPLPGCPPGKDCIGQELALRKAPIRDSNNGAPQNATRTGLICKPEEFVGYNCARAQPSEEDDPGSSLINCPSAFYCPSPLERYTCPAGYSCHKGSTFPEECLAGSACPEGTFQGRFYAPLIATIIALCLTAAFWYWSRRKRQHVAVVRNQNDTSALSPTSRGSTTELQPTAIQVKSIHPDAAKSQPKLIVTFDHVSVAVRDANAVATPASPVAWADDSESKRLVTKYGEKFILNDITGSIRGGRLTAIMGPSGSGKSTFLNALLNKVPISHGTIRVNHTHTVPDLISLNVLGFVPQVDTMLTMMTVRDLVTHSAYMRLPGAMAQAAKLQRVDAVCQLLGISHLLDTPVGDEQERGLSGGEKKRVSIAMELVADPLVLLLDEPTSGQCTQERAGGGQAEGARSPAIRDRCCWGLCR
jgi:ABC-type lipoprotein export system ATPase subunit